MHEVHVLDLLVPEAGAFYVMDRGYLDFRRFARLDAAGAFFVTRSKRNVRFTRLESADVDPTTGVWSDMTVALTRFRSEQGYAKPLRRIHYRDPETTRHFVYLTNHSDLPALTVCDLYRQRWQVELFFRWIKQHLRIKAFCGTSQNAVKTQIWSAVCVYVLVAIVRKRLRIEASMHTILQILSLTLFDETPLDRLLQRVSPEEERATDPSQLNLFA